MTGGLQTELNVANPHLATDTMNTSNVLNFSTLSLILNFTGFENGNFCAEAGPNGSDFCEAPFLVEITPIEIVVIIFLSLFIFGIIVGNIFVIMSVLLFREMRTMTNGLIVSLASADLLVALIVLPISLHFEVVGQWTLGTIVCDFYVTSDVFCCTASILNIVVIAVDRYWLITKNVKYTHNTTFPRQRVCLVMVFLAWTTSAIISTSPLFGWRRGTEREDPTQCMISQDLSYTIFSTFGAFWFPLTVILLVYSRIFSIARRRARTRAKARSIHPSIHSTAGFSEMNEMNGGGSSSSKRNGRYRQQSVDSQSPPRSPSSSRRSHLFSSRRRGTRTSMDPRTRFSRTRMRNSARTLGLIIGGFVLCWLPFFLIATMQPFCSHCKVPKLLFSIVLWLGYSNSLLNPAIYAIWDKKFRRSFKRLATCDIRWSLII